MKETLDNIIKKDLLLIGAGHAHLEVIKYLGKKRLPGLRITLLTMSPYSTYSGMVPGYIEEQYTWEQINIDVVNLAFKNNIRVVIGEATKVSGKKKRVCLKDKRVLEFDYLSINTGIKSDFESITGAQKNAYPLKPISEINNTINSVVTSKAENIAIVGAGAAGVEVTLALHKKLEKLNIKKKLILISKNKTLMKSYPKTVASNIVSIFKKKNIEILYNSKVSKINESSLEINNKKIYNCCSVLATSASSTSLVKDSDLTKSRRGFLLVKHTLQVKNFECIFASGDVADIENLDLPKAGVYAVRQAETLKKNLESLYLKRSLKKFYPQKYYLSLIGLANCQAIAHKYFITLKGNIFWNIKKYIDKQFIKKYFSLHSTNLQKLPKDINLLEPNEYKMQCDGCGNKIPQNILSKVFKKNFLLGSLDAEKVSGTNNLVHTVDVITSIVDDPYLLGKIAAKHSVNDLFAASSYPVSSQMILSISKSLGLIQRRDIYQLTEGANSIFKELGIEISGGHTYNNESSKTAIGFSVIGKVKKTKYTNVNKSKIFMTGKIGTALVMAALKQNLISGKYYIELINEMSKSNLSIYKIFKKNNISNITDISGFGLAAHLKNLLIRNKDLVGANIYLDKISILEGAKEAMKKKVISSLTYSNKNNIINNLNILFDPQTAGGFLFATEELDIVKKFKKINIEISEIGEISKNHSKIRVF